MERSTDLKSRFFIFNFFEVTLVPHLGVKLQFGLRHSEWRQDKMSNLNGFGLSIVEAQEENSDGYAILKHDQKFSLRLKNTHRYEGKQIPCDVDVYIQGRACGTFRIQAGQTIILERPENDSGHFTAYKNNTLEAKQAGIDKDSYENGLIKVVFKPGKIKERCQWVNPLPYVPCTWPSWPYIEPTTPYEPYEPWTITYTDNTNYNNTTSDVNNCSRKLRSISASCSSYSEGNHYLTESCYEAGSGNLVGGGVGLSGSSNQTFSEVEALEYLEQATTIYLRIAFRNEEPRPLTSQKVYKVCSSIPRPLR